MYYENKAQEALIEHINGPTLCAAVPGAGKTTTMLRRIHHIIELGNDPYSILMVTFSNAAAKEMKEKYIKMYGSNPGVTFMTIHSLCFNILKREGLADADSIIKESEAWSFICDQVVKNKVSQKEDLKETVSAIQTEVSVIKNNYFDLKGGKYTPQSIKDKDAFVRIFSAYEDMKAENGKIDFDDMLVKTAELFRRDRDTLYKWQMQFRYIMVDEYQDTNFLQRDIVYMLADQYRNLCVVGDDDQSIYFFRGARPEIMLGFDRDFEDCTVINMDTNYRCAGNIVNVADSLISMNGTRIPKKFISFRGMQGAKGDVGYLQFGDKNAQMADIVKKIKAYHAQGVPFNEMAILYRTNKQARIPVAFLSGEKIPFYLSEPVKSIYDGWIFNDLLAYINLSSQTGRSMDKVKKDLLRIINHPQRYLDAKYFGGCTYDIGSLTKACSYLRTNDWKYSNAITAVEKWMRLFGPGKITSETSPQDLFNRFSRTGLNYPKYITDWCGYRGLDVSEYREEYEEIKKDALQFSTLKEWFDNIRKVQFASKGSDAKNREGVFLGSLHKSKGLEWTVVFIIDINSQVIPHKRSMENKDLEEEERRLFYVGMTRAKDHLHLSSSGPESPFLGVVKRAIGDL